MAKQDDSTGARSSATGLHLDRRTYLATGTAAVVSLFGTGTAAASNRSAAASPAYDVRRYEIDRDGMGDAQTNTPPFCPRLVTCDDRQYFAYWTQPGELVVVARDLPDGDWERNRTGIRIGSRDGHWTPAIGIGPDKHVFITYNTRDSRIRWRRSTAPEDISSFEDTRIGMTGQNESSVTYGEYTRLLDGTLLFAYRNGRSGNGDWTMNRWDGETGEWTPLQHPLTDGQANGVTNNSYHWNLVQSDDGVLHYFFTWRGTGGVQTNENLLYARSPDGGETWTRSDGTAYDLPLAKGDAELVERIPQGSDLINQGWSSYDPRTNDPHVAYYHDDEDGNTQVFHAYLDNGTWSVEAVTDRDSSVNFGGGGVVGSPIGRMGIVVDDDGAVTILTRDFESGGWPLLYTKTDGEWYPRYVYERNLTYADIHIDPYRWREDRVLSFVDQQQTIGDTPWTPGTLMAVTDIEPTGNAGGPSLDLSATGHYTPFASTSLATDSTTVTTGWYSDTSAALALTETSVPATPTYARARAEIADGTGRIRVKMQDDSGSADTVYSDPAAATSDGATVSTAWTKFPDAFRAGFVNVQAASDDGSITLRNVELEIGYDAPMRSGGKHGQAQEERGERR